MTETLAIVDFGSGNLRSVAKAFERVVREQSMALRVVVTERAQEVAAADRVVLPGVGAFRAAMTALGAMDDMIFALEHAVLVKKRPFLGICVGMQILAEAGLEYGETQGLGWIGGTVRRLEPSGGLKVPQMGWNTVEVRDGDHQALQSLRAARRDLYFVHSFHFDVENSAYRMGVCDYGGEIVSIAGRDNILGVQFHPEKSQAAGLAFLADFLAWRP
jgi:glutamine amidotransferase